MSYITFIIPTLGRQTLSRTIDSIYLQKSNDWKAIIIFDGIKNNLSGKYANDKRIIILEKPKTGFINSRNISFAGEVRNYAFDLVDTKWIGFIDDDDVILPNYIEELKKEDDEKKDFILFRMNYDKVVPKIGINTIIHNEAGISFVVKNEIVKKHNLRFKNDGSEDFHFLKNMENLGLKYIVSEAITYEVCEFNRDKK